MLARHTCLAVALLTQAEARAPEPLGVLALAVPPGPGPKLIDVASELRRAIAERRADVVDRPVLRLRMTGPTSAAPEEIDRAFEGARAASLAGDHQAAMKTLQSILEEVEKLPDSQQTFGQWVRAVTHLARLELDLGRREAARALLDRLVQAAPDVELDRDLHPGRFLQLLESARAAVRAGPSHRLEIGASMPGARIYVNRREVGRAPLSLHLARGQYRISAALPESRVLPFTVDLREADQRVAIDFAVPESLRPDLGPGLALPERDRSSRVIAAGGYLGLAELVAVQLLTEGGAEHAQGSLYDVRRGMLVREGRLRLQGGALPPGGAPALADYLLSGSNERGLVEVPGSDLRSPPRALGWTALATGIGSVGLAALAAVEMSSASRSYGRARSLRSGGLATYEAVVQYNRAVSQGDAARRAGTAAWVGAGVAAAATGALGYLNYRRTGEWGPFRF